MDDHWLPRSKGCGVLCFSVLPATLGPCRLCQSRARLHLGIDERKQVSISASGCAATQLKEKVVAEPNVWSKRLVTGTGRDKKVLYRVLDDAYVTEEYDARASVPQLDELRFHQGWTYDLRNITSSIAILLPTYIPSCPGEYPLDFFLWRINPISSG